MLTLSALFRRMSVLLPRFTRNSLQLLKVAARAKSRLLSAGALQMQQKVQQFMYIKYFPIIHLVALEFMLCS